jgi:hypothetical protein
MGSHDIYDKSSEDEYRERYGQEPPWTRVYRDGVDVTDTPELWPEWRTNPEVLRGRRGGRSKRR